MIDRTSYHNEPALELKTGALRLVAPLGYGPRIMRFSSANGPNLLIDLNEDPGSGDTYLFRGGHRLWHAPEHPERSCQPDNDPVVVEFLPGNSGFVLRQKTEEATGIAKMIQVGAAGPKAVRIDHELTNHGLWPITCAPWALTMFRPGGHVIVPLPPKGEHPRDLLPTFSLVPWPYTDLSASAWKFHRDFIRLDTRAVTAPQKIGITNYPGWLAYWLDGEVFIKSAPATPAAACPDFGCQAEIFSNGTMAELETLAPLTTLQPGDAASHHEYWGVLSNLPEPLDDATVRAKWLPAIEDWQAQLPSAFE